MNLEKIQTSWLESANGAGPPVYHPERPANNMACAAIGSTHCTQNQIFAFCSLFYYTVRAVSLKLYLISCDLLYPGDYVSFKERLRVLNATQVLATQWAVRTHQSAAELKELLRGFLDERDRIVVTEVGEEKASRRALADLGKL